MTAMKTTEDLDLYLFAIKTTIMRTVIDTKTNGAKPKVVLWTRLADSAIMIAPPFTRSNVATLFVPSFSILRFFALIGALPPIARSAVSFNTERYTPIPLVVAVMTLEPSVLAACGATCSPHRGKSRHSRE
jgi:hypothetical protein